MTRVAFVADCHLGNHKRFGGPVESSLNRRAREGLDVLRRAVVTARHKGCSTFTVAGDLFDYDRPEPQLIAATQRVFEQRGGEDHLGIWALVGNHEQVSNAEGDHAMGPLEPVVNVVEQPTWVNIPPSHGGRPIVMGLIPFRRGKASDWLPEAVRQLFADVPRAHTRILALHLGISDSKTAPWLLSAPDAIDVCTLRDIVRESNVRAVFAGNWHDRQIWRFDDLTVLQIGALVPTGFDNPGMHGFGTLAIFDDRASDPVSFHEISGPRYIKVTKASEIPQSDQNKIYASVTAPRTEFGAVSADFGRAVESGRLVAAEVLPDTSENAAAARSAADAAKAAGTLDEALSKFVGEMHVAEGVKRDDVLTRSRKYLGR